MAIHGCGPFLPANVNSPSVAVEGIVKKVRKPYTITKPREIWTSTEHEKFVEAIQMYDRDWAKIKDFIGSKTVVQIRSHAQKYFIKMQKSGSKAYAPPPRPKKKAKHPYPLKAQESAPVPSEPSNFPATAAFGSGDFMPANSFFASIMPANSTSLHVPGSKLINSCSIIDCNCKIPSLVSMNQSLNGHATRSQDYAEVYTLIGSSFETNTSDLLQKFKSLGTIDSAASVLFMNNLAANIRSPNFEFQRMILSGQTDLA